jgi:very-short-patch-repair endonuclease
MSERNRHDLKSAKNLARELRKNATDSEKLLWTYLRNRRLAGYKFLRQHPVIYKADRNGLNYFIADFYCDAKKLVIELDGLIHNNTQEYDHFRDDQMKNKGLNVLRIKNEELDDINNTLTKIIDFLNSLS